jgi:probable HAF family extracellular repeat protein
MFRYAKVLHTAGAAVLINVSPVGAAAAPLIDLGAPTGLSNSDARSVNDLGHIAAYSSSNNRSYFYDGTYHDIGSLSGKLTSGTIATGINNSDAIVGTSFTLEGYPHAFVWKDGVMTDLGTLDSSDPANFSEANAINDSGQVVGRSKNADGESMRSYGKTG